MNTNMPQDPHFNKQYQSHLKFLKLDGLQSKTVDTPEWPPRKLWL
jgi:hypothetical protein